MFPRPSFFSGARLNFAENLLYPQGCYVDENSIAAIGATEKGKEYVTWRELRERVRQCSAAMRTLGIQQNDRVAGFLANHINAVVAMLSAVSIGAIWTGVSPDTGVHAVLDRLQQIEPVLVFADNAVIYNGKTHDVHEKVRDVVQELHNLKAVVIFKTVESHGVNLSELNVSMGKAWTYDDFIKSVDAPNAELQFEQLDPDHPVYILYSSGTTGSMLIPFSTRAAASTSPRRS
jgi:acetoacetyl-CoA synthetase